MPVSGERSIRLAVAFARGMSRAPGAGWCGVGVEFLMASGVGITVMGRDAAGPLCVSDEAVAVLEDAQFTVGEGPCPERSAPVCRCRCRRSGVRPPGGGRRSLRSPWRTGWVRSDPSPLGELAPEMDDAVAHRAEVYQASGILAVQLGIPPAAALVRLRAHAFANDEPLDIVASAIVDRRLRLDGEEHS
jgi:hypothetical protein